MRLPMQSLVTIAETTVMAYPKAAEMTPREKVAFLEELVARLLGHQRQAREGIAPRQRPNGHAEGPAP